LNCPSRPLVNPLHDCTALTFPIPRIGWIVTATDGNSTILLLANGRRQAREYAHAFFAATGIVSGAWQLTRDEKKQFNSTAKGSTNKPGTIFFDRKTTLDGFMETLATIPPRFVINELAF